MQELRSFYFKCFKTATSKGSKIKIYDSFYKTQKTIYSNNSNFNINMAKKYLKLQGIKIKHYTLIKNEYVLLSNDFKTQIK